MKRIILFFLLAVLFIPSAYAQESIQNDSVDVTVIDSYVTPEIPHKFLLSFFTSEKCRSQVIIDNKYNYPVSDSLSVDHNIKIDITKLSFKTKSVPFVIVVEDSAGRKFTSDKYDFELPGEIKVQSESNFMLLCLFGAAVFALPSPVYVHNNNGNYFSLTKEIPLLTFRSSGYTYPSGYFSAEYSYIFNSPEKNFLRLGYKQLIVIPVFEYISPGVDLFTDFKGDNGVSAEFSVGLVKIFNTFTVYTRYRYNFIPNNSGMNFHEISLGLYSSFFSIYL